MIQLLLRNFAWFSLLAGLAGGSAAHGPTRQKVVEQISINAPADQNDEAAVAAVTEMYKSGLANLKALVERK